MSFHERRGHCHESEYDYYGEAPAPPPAYQGRYGYNAHGFNGDGYNAPPAYQGRYGYNAHGFNGDGYAPNSGYVNYGGYVNGGPGYDRHNYERVHEDKKYQQNDRLGDLGAVASTAFALLEGNKTGTTSTNKPTTGLPNNIASLGSAAYAAYEQYEKYKGSR